MNQQVNTFENEVYGMTKIILLKQAKMLKDLDDVKTWRNEAQSLSKKLQDKMTQNDIDLISRMMYSYSRLLDVVGDNFMIQNEYFKESQMLQRDVSNLKFDVSIALKGIKLKG